MDGAPYGVAHMTARMAPIALDSCHTEQPFSDLPLRPVHQKPIERLKHEGEPGGARSFSRFTLIDPPAMTEPVKPLNRPKPRRYVRLFQREFCQQSYRSPNVRSGNRELQRVTILLK